MFVALALAFGWLVTVLSPVTGLIIIVGQPFSANAPSAAAVSQSARIISSASNNSRYFNTSVTSSREKSATSRKILSCGWPAIISSILALHCFTISIDEVNSSYLTELLNESPHTFSSEFDNVSMILFSKGWISITPSQSVLISFNISFTWAEPKPSIVSRPLAICSLTSVFAAFILSPNKIAPVAALNKAYTAYLIALSNLGG